MSTDASVLLATLVALILLAFEGLAAAAYMRRSIARSRDEMARELADAQRWRERKRLPW
jgi:hypothetical protein